MILRGSHDPVGRIVSRSAARRKKTAAKAGLVALTVLPARPPCAAAASADAPMRTLQTVGRVLIRRPFAVHRHPTGGTSFSSGTVSLLYVLVRGRPGGQCGRRSPPRSGRRPRFEAAPWVRPRPAGSASPQVPKNAPTPGGGGAAARQPRGPRPAARGGGDGGSGPLCAKGGGGGAPAPPTRRPTLFIQGAPRPRGIGRGPPIDTTVGSAAARCARSTMYPGYSAPRRLAVKPGRRWRAATARPPAQHGLDQVLYRAHVAPSCSLVGPKMGLVQRPSYCMMCTLI